MKKTSLLIAMALSAVVTVSGQNPYMPLWEHIPDGEPYVFEDPDNPGKQRVYVYGSHDIIRTDYCGEDQVVWSAPVEDLSAWRYDGVIFKSQYGPDGKALHNDGHADVLFAPDVTERIENGKKVYYLCPNNQAEGRKTMVARADRPDGPFKVCNWNSDTTTKGCFGFDPAIFVDDDGRVYGYWGFIRSYAAELDPTTMYSVKPGTEVVEDLVTGSKQPGIFRFFEASSIRKVMGKYVFIYSRYTEDGEFGLPVSNYTLAYAYSNNPLGPYTYGGTIIDARGRGTDESGKAIETATIGGNTHGSICEINGRWWVFYHRQTGTNVFSRQAMVAPVDVHLEGDKVVISEGEYTSEGFSTEGLNPLARHQAGIACYYTGPERIESKYPNYEYSGSYVAATYPGDNGLDASYSLNNHHSPVINNTDGSIVGYKYFNFNHFNGRDKAEFMITMKPHGVKGRIVVMTDSPWESKGGKVLGQISLTDKDTTEGDYKADIKGLKDLKGKHALFLRFYSDEKGKSLADLYDFIFR